MYSCRALYAGLAWEPEANLLPAGHSDGRGVGPEAASPARGIWRGFCLRLRTDGIQSSNDNEARDRLRNAGSVALVVGPSERQADCRRAFPLSPAAVAT